MSVLLEALKNAAMEKMNRDQNNNSNGSSQDSEDTPQSKVSLGLNLPKPELELEAEEQHEEQKDHAESNFGEVPKEFDEILSNNEAIKKKEFEEKKGNSDESIEILVHIDDEVLDDAGANLADDQNSIENLEKKDLYEFENENVKEENERYPKLDDENIKDRVDKDKKMEKEEKDTVDRVDKENEFVDGNKSEKKLLEVQDDTSDEKFNLVPSEGSEIRKNSIKEEELRKKSFRELSEKRLEQDKKKRNNFILIYIILILISLSIVGAYYYLTIRTSQNSSIAINPSLLAFDPANMSAEDQYDDANTELNVLEQEESLEGSISESPQGKVIKETVTLVEQPLPSDPTVKTIEKEIDENFKKLSHSKNTPKSVWSNKNSRSLEAKPILVSESSVNNEKRHVSELEKAIDLSYRAYQSGDYETAKRGYDSALNISPDNGDALLGRAAIAMIEGQYQKALSLYERRLLSNPLDESAKAGVLSIASIQSYDPKIMSQVEDQLKDNPELAHLHFIKGAMLAKQLNWMGAQKSFFLAWHREPNRFEYALNLAISLDKLNQSDEALRFYKISLENLSFNRYTENASAIKVRINHLEKQP